VREFIITHDSGILVNFIAKTRVIVGFSFPSARWRDYVYRNFRPSKSRGLTNQLTSSLNKLIILSSGAVTTRFSIKRILLEPSCVRHIKKHNNKNALSYYYYCYYYYRYLHSAVSVIGLTAVDSAHK
jgi:hypothetical protein